MEETKQTSQEKQEEDHFERRRKSLRKAKNLLDVLVDKNDKNESK